ARVHLYNRSRGGASIARLIEDYQMDAAYFGQQSNDFLIIQCGVVDCAPRPLPTTLRALVSRLPKHLRSKVIRFLHDNRAFFVSKGPTWRVARPSSFMKAYQYWLERAVKECDRIYCVNIAPTTDEIESRSPGFSESIELYNRLIEEAVLSVRSE